MSEPTKFFLDLMPMQGLWFALACVCMFAKRTPFIPDWFIPWMAALLGMIFYPMIASPGSVTFSLPYPLVAKMITGFFIGATTVWGHQIFRQTMKRIFGQDIEQTTVTTTVETPEKKLTVEDKRTVTETIKDPEAK